MKVVALISGGKDSCFNMMHCIRNGHEIVALAHLKPEEKEELDSYMFQTVGHNIIELYAEALGLPLFQRTISGSSVCTDADYFEDSTDEVEDLYEILKEVKNKIDINAVSSGAILSNYQRTRVENVCGRLGLQSLSYLWQQKQEGLLNEMIQADVEAILIKVAALGLKPHAHLGKTLREMAPHLNEMNKKFELNVCGEGGEYETITLDCPLFLKRIVIDEKHVVIHSDDAFAPVGYLSFKKMHLEDKGMDACMTLTQRMTDCNLQIPMLLTGIIDYITNGRSREKTACNSNMTCTSIETTHTSIETTRTSIEIEKYEKTSPQVVSANDRAWVCNLDCHQDGVETVEESTARTMKHLSVLLEERDFKMTDISLIRMFCSSMKHFAKINSVYKNFFLLNPPARVCVEIPLPVDTVFRMDVCLDRPKNSTRNSLHVQSISYWAPANIGPYSQVISVGNQAYFSGSIGMDPATLNVINGGFEQEATLSLHHVNEVSKVFIPNRKSLKDHGLVNCFIVDQSQTDNIKELFNRQQMFDSSRYLLNVVTVPSLPKNALVEWQIVSKYDGEQSMGDISIYGDESFRFNINFFKLVIRSTDFENKGNLRDVFVQYLHQYNYIFKKTEFMSMYYLHHVFDVNNGDDIRNIFSSSILESVVEVLPAISFVPVNGLEKDVVIAITGSTCD